MANRSRTRSEKSDSSSLCCLTGHAETEYFWCTELNANTKSATWIIKSEDTEDEEDEDFINHILIARMAVLNANAVSGEPNIVELQSEGQDGEMQKGIIANLTHGLNPMTLLNYTIQGKIGCTFTLVEGSGPVIISGSRLLEFPRDDDQMMDATQCTEPEKGDKEEVDDDDDDEDDSDEKGKGKKSIKRKASSKASKQKKIKIDELDDEEEEEEEDEDDDDDDDDADFEEVKTKQAKKVKDTGKNTKAKAKMEKDSGKKLTKKMKK